VLYDFGTEAGCDGMCVDAGNLSHAALEAPGVLVLTPEGKEIAFIPRRASQPGRAVGLE
jgi:hypothetical protein